MDTKGIWRSFTDTGDPVCYLLAKKLEQPPDRNSAKKPRRVKAEKERTGDKPRPSD